MHTYSIRVSDKQNDLLLTERKKRVNKGRYEPRLTTISRIIRDAIDTTYEGKNDHN